MPRVRPALAAAMLFIVLAGVTSSFGPAAGVRAASPAPSAAGGDTRSAGEAPGFVGSPLLAIGAVVVLGATAALVTVAYIRLTGGPGRER